MFIGYEKLHSRSSPFQLQWTEPSTHHQQLKAVTFASLSPNHLGNTKFTTNTKLKRTDNMWDNIETRTLNKNHPTSQSKLGTRSKESFHSLSQPAFIWMNAAVIYFFPFGTHSLSSTTAFGCKDFFTTPATVTLPSDRQQRCNEYCCIRWRSVNRR